MVPLRKRRLRMRGHGGPNFKAIDPGDPDMAVPRALRSLSTQDENKFIRESGFSKDHTRRVWEL